jgi:hypothetical protein
MNIIQLNSTKINTKSTIIHTKSMEISTKSTEICTTSTTEYVNLTQMLDLMVENNGLYHGQGQQNSTSFCNLL